MRVSISRYTYYYYVHSLKELNLKKEIKYKERDREKEREKKLHFYRQRSPRNHDKGKTNEDKRIFQISTDSLTHPISVCGGKFRRSGIVAACKDPPSVAPSTKRLTNFNRDWNALYSFDSSMRHLVYRRRSSETNVSKVSPLWEELDVSQRREFVPSRSRMFSPPLIRPRFIRVSRDRLKINPRVSFEGGSRASLNIDFQSVLKGSGLSSRIAIRTKNYLLKRSIRLFAYLFIYTRERLTIATSIYANMQIKEK